MRHGCTEAQFMKRIEGVELEIVQDVEVHRHLRFRKPDTSSEWFDIITWPGTLCISGDYGTFVFARVSDMLTFFRQPEGHKQLQINHGYWSEKLRSIDHHGGYEEFSADSFERSIRAAFDGWEFDSKTQKQEAWEEVKHSVLRSDNEYEAMNAAIGFEFEGHEFRDFWECNCREYTYRFTHNLYAIVWGIQQYDKAKGE